MVFFSVRSTLSVELFSWPCVNNLTISFILIIKTSSNLMHILNRLNEQLWFQKPYFSFSQTFLKFLFVPTILLFLLYLFPLLIPSIEHLHILIPDRPQHPPSLEYLFELTIITNYQLIFIYIPKPSIL